LHIRKPIAAHRLIGRIDRAETEIVEEGNDAVITAGSRQRLTQRGGCRRMKYDV
jgi:hypothetical protein